MVEGLAFAVVALVAVVLADRRVARWQSAHLAEAAAKPELEAMGVRIDELAAEVKRARAQASKLALEVGMKPDG